MNRVAWRSIRAHAKQFILTALAVVLGVTFLSGTLALRGVLSETFSALTSSTATADLYVIGPSVAAQSGSSGSLSQPIDASLEQTVASVDGVRSAHASVSMNGVLVGSDDAPVTSTGAPTVVFPLFADDDGVRLVSGTRPSAEGEIALESNALKRSGLAVGDTTTLVLSGTPHTVTVVGEISYGTSMAGATVIAASPDWLTPLASPDGKATAIEAHLADGADTATVKQAIAEKMPEGVRVQTRAEYLDDINSSIEKILGYVQTFLMVFVVLAMFVGSFIIMNTFSMSVRQRIKEFALMRAIGASPASVFRIVILQALAVGVVGSALGVLGGAGLTKGIVALLESVGMPLPAGVPMTSSVITTSIIVGVLVTVIGALLPAREAALVAPVEAMRGVSGAREKSLVLRGSIGMLLAAAGAAGVIAAWASAGLSHRTAALGAGAGALIIGLLIASPVLSRPIVALIGLPLRLIRPGGRLAARNIVHNPRRTAATSAALLIGMSLVCAGATIAASMRHSITSIVNDSLHADFMVQPASSSTDTHLSPEMVSQIQGIDGVASTTGFTAYLVQTTKADGTQGSGFLDVVDPAAYQAAYDPNMVSGSFTDMDADHVIAFESSGFKVGDTVTLTGSNGSREVTVAGVSNTQGTSGTLWSTPEVAAAVGSISSPAPTQADQVLASPFGMFVTLEKGTDASAVKDQIKEIVKPTYVYQVQNADEISDAAGQQATRMLAVLYGLLGLSIVIAILGIVNTLVLSVAERTREIGLMRAIGLGKTQLASEIVVESVLTALYGTILGGATGVLLAGALRATLEKQGLTELVIPWGQLVAMMVVAAVVGVIAAVWPALRASRMPVLEAIATE